MVIMLDSIGSGNLRLQGRVSAAQLRLDQLINEYLKIKNAPEDIKIQILNTDIFGKCCLYYFGKNNSF